VGPGAGFALLSSFLVLFVTILIALFSILILPFRFLWRLVRRRRKVKPHIQRLIVVGLDGQDPKITDRLMAEGKLPNFQKLAESGCYHPLETTYPSVSPVAWSSFSTGTSPAKHNIFDFLDRDLKTYLPRLSSAKIGSVEKFLKIGKFRIPLQKPELRLLRKSKPFWTILGEHDIWSTVLRVPITFPPDEFYGAELSAMCVPDLLGTQGTFLLFTTRPAQGRFKEGGVRVPVELRGERVETVLEGPPNMFLEGDPPLTLPMTLDLDRAAGTATVRIGDEEVTLPPGKLSPWVPLTFSAAPGIKVRGIARMMVTEMDEHLSLYVAPIALDPEKPAMPISHPGYYATYLAKRIGPYSTLGLAEDTWALNEEVIDDGTFLEMTYDIDRERQDMFFAALDRLRRGTLVCVFDATDRIQHMFWRYTEKGHPAARGKENAEHRNAIEELYRHNDALVGRVMARMEEGDVLMVCSDHGFSSFRRGVNLNAWLLEEGYLHLKDGADGSTEWLRDVDWSRTRAYALGLTGMYLNVRGREAEGIVEPGAEAAALKEEIRAKLSGLKDAETGDVGVREAFDTARLYQGPYLRHAPDLLIGYNAGYRTSWDCATGVVAGPVFEDNTKAWSGDHCIDPRLVPGVFFCNREIQAEDPALIDIAPTALTLFDLEPPKHMEGKALFDVDELAARRARPRRRAAKAAAALLALLLPALFLLAGCGGETQAATAGKRVIVLGMDGLDYDLTAKLMAEGRLPNFSRLAELGGFSKLATAIPPQSPVAWSDFITGMDAGGHGIFDFLHRDPKSKIPYLSTSRSVVGEPRSPCLFGKWQIPGSGEVELLRYGKPFWQALEEHGVSTAVFRMPANFPPSGEASFELTGMGTPDLKGTSGMFSFYTSELFAFAGEDLSGGDVYEVDAFDNVVHSALYGPENPFLCEPEELEAPFTVHIDPKEEAAKLVLGDEERVLRVGEWSDWVPFEFEMIPTQSVPAVARFYLRAVRPEFEMYVSPLQIDPMNPALPVSHPAGFAGELAEATGRFYTQGMPEDTKTLSDGVFEPEEFLAQAEIAGREIADQYRYVLDRFQTGLLFYYFGRADQVSHMMWRSLDPEHPAYDPEVDPKYADVIPSIYEELDEIVGYTLDRMGPETTLVVMSDHGFTSLRRVFNLNSWLRDHGYLAVKDPNLQRDPGLFANVDWSRTKAYGVGFTGLYINLQGREEGGIVPPGEREALMERIAEDLLATVDPATGGPAVTKVYFREEGYDDRGHLEIGPDLQVGYAKHYGGSNESVLGELTPEVISDNTDPWSGNHIMDHEAVPGILLTNRALPKPARSLEELAAAILAELGVEGFPEAETSNEPPVARTASQTAAPAEPPMGDQSGAAPAP